jgi:MFS family permease
MTTEILPLAADAAVSRKGNTGSLLLISFGLFMATAVAGAFAPMIEAAKASMGLSDVQISMVAGLAAALPTGLLAVPVGRMIDRMSRVRILFGLALLWSAGALVQAFAPTFEMLFVGRMLASFGMFTSVPVGISLAADLSRPENRGKGVMALSLGNKLGAAAAFMIVAPLLGFFAQSGETPLGLEPWRAVQLVFGVASLVLAVPLLFLREPARQEIITKDSIGFGDALKAVWSRRGFLAPLFLGQVGVVMADYAAMVWASPVLIRNYGMSEAEAGLPIGLAILVAGIVGSIIGGVAADWGQKIKFKGGILLGAVVMALIAIPSALFPIMPDATTAMIALTVLLLTGSAAGLVTATVIAVKTPNEIRGVCLGAFIVGGALIGLGLAPMLVSYGSLLMGGEQNLAPALAIVGLVINVISFAAFALAMFRTPASATAL